MKKLLFLAVLAMVMFSCAKNEGEQEAVSHEHALNRGCAAHEVLQQQLLADPTLQARMDEIERFTEEAIRSGDRVLLPSGEIQIPVVFNVLYKTTAQNVSLTQLQSQVDVLNKDFKALNSEYGSIPAAFAGLASGATGIVFTLDAVVRKKTNKSSWQANDAMKKSTQGGLNPTSPTTKLNIWVCNLSGGILGYAQFPGGPSATDGVVLDDNATGNTGTASAPFNKGRTATHEVGHWLNLRHIWGDATCGNDQVADTPTHNTANYGCPAQPHYSTCTGAPREMTMNYMDYTDDACMYMFSINQKERMQATFVSGGPRNSFAQ
ncbi:MAG: zinc metalloprotease [Saprospiraceae bacterium]|nr:zinc metalloprotease [Saprospiraceae bacterium]